MIDWLKKLVSGSPAEATETKPEVSAEVGQAGADGSFQNLGLSNDTVLANATVFAVAPGNFNTAGSTKLDSATIASDADSRAQTPALDLDPDQTPAPALVIPKAKSPALDPSLDLDPDQPPTPALVIPKAKSPALDPALDLDPDQTPALDLDLPPVTVPALAPAPDPVSIIDPIINLVDSIFTKDNEDPLKKYFFSIFIPPEDDDTKKSTASTPSPAPTITPAQETELRETLEKCANAYISGDTNLPPSDSSDPQSGSTKTTSKSSQILKEKAEPPVYFGVGIKTELAEDGEEKFLKITEIFSNSNLRKEKQGNVDYTNQFITHLNCKLEDDTEAREYSITDIFNKFKGDPNQKEKFDEKIDRIFRDISQTSIKFKISADKSQPASSEVNIDKIIFEKTPDGAYKQKTTTPSPITEIRDATGKGVGAGLAGLAGVAV